MAVSDLLPSFFYANETGNTTAEQLKRRQAIAAAMAARQRKMPTTLGEGLTYLGESVADRMQEERLRQAELAMVKGDAAAKVQAQQGPPAAPAAGVPAPTVPKVAAPPLPGASPNSYDVPLPTYGGVPYRPATTVPREDPHAPQGVLTVRDRIAQEMRKREEVQSQAAPEVAQGNPTLPGSQAPVPAEMLPVASIQGDQEASLSSPGGQPDPMTERRRAAYGGMESGGRGDPYATVVDAGRGRTVYGKYGIMDSNIPAWTQAALGRSMTPQQFLADRNAQDATFDHRIGDYVRKYGEEGAARAWYAGEGGMNNLNARDRFGRLNVQQYGQDILRRLGPRAEGPLQTRMASLNTGVTSDAPQIVPSIPGVSDDENPPTPSDIKPAPPQVAQAGGFTVSDLYSPSPMAPQRGAPPPASAPAPAPASGPRQLVDVPRDPGPMPTMPGPTEEMVRWHNLANNPWRGEGVRAEAAARFKMLYEQQEKVYGAQLELWKQAKGKFDDPETAIKLKQGTATLDKTATEHEKLVRDLNEPRKATVRGTEFQQPYTRPGEPVQPYAVPPGLPGPKEDLTETQSKATQFVLRVRPDLEHVEQKLQYGKAMTDPVDAAKDKVPGVGNFLVSPEYRQVRDALGNWGAGFLNLVSGATVTPGEALLQLPAFVPRPGDSPQEVLDKARRRRDFTDAAEKISGEDGKKIIREQVGALNDDYLFKENAQKDPVPVKTPADAQLLPPGQRIILPDGTSGQVPKRKRGP